jgi:hypothetical protein
VDVAPHARAAEAIRRVGHVLLRECDTLAPARATLWWDRLFKHLQERASARAGSPSTPSDA